MPEFFRIGFFRSIAFRLTVWYAGIFSISSCVAFGLFYFLATQTIMNQVDQELIDKAGYFRTVISRGDCRCPESGSH